MIRLLWLASVVLACACRGENPPPPRPRASSTSPAAGSLDTVLIPAALYVPHGFTVNLFAEGLNGGPLPGARSRGAVYASLPGAGQIVRLRDAKRRRRRGRAGANRAERAQRPFGIAFPAIRCTLRERRP